MSCKSNILKVFDPEKSVELTFHLNNEDYERASTDDVYVQELVNTYYANQESIASTSTNEYDRSLPSTSKATNNESINEYDSFWSENETIFLISLYEDHKDDFCNAKKKKFVWDIIAEKMATKNYHRSAAKVERKWINLVRVYRSIKDNKGPKKTGRGAHSYKYFERLDEVLGTKPSNIEENSCIDVGTGLSELQPPKESAEIDDPPSTESTDSKEQIAQTTLLKRKRSYKEEAKNKRHKERMEIEKEKLNIEKEKILLLKEYLDLQSKSISNLPISDSH